MFVNRASVQICKQKSFSIFKHENIFTTEIKYQPTNIAKGTFIFLKLARGTVPVRWWCSRSRVARRTVELLRATRIQLSHSPGFFFFFPLFVSSFFGKIFKPKSFFVLFCCCFCFVFVFYSDSLLIIPTFRK